MVRIETDPNYTAPTFSRATAPTDPFKKEDVQNVAAALSTHDHTTGKGLPMAAGSIPNGTITSAMLADGTIDTADLKDGAVTSAKIFDGTIATADLANQAVTNAKLSTDTARANLLTNGGFEIWQRGGAAVTSGFTSDRWQIEGTSLTVVQEGAPANVDSGSQFSARVTHTGASSSNLTQLLEAYPGALRRCVLSFSARVRATVAACVRLQITSDGSAPVAVTGVAHTGGGAWETLTAVGFTVPADATKVYLRVQFLGPVTGGTHYVDNAMVVVGTVPADYAPLHPAEDLARCFRYYQLLKLVIRAKAGAAGDTFAHSLPFKSNMAVTPTFTLGTVEIQANNTGGWPGAQSLTPYGGGFQTISAAAGDTYWFGAAQMEANP